MENFIKWLSSNITFDTILTLIGFVIAFIELRRTKNAAIAARDATKKTIQELSDRATISDIETLINGLIECQTAFRGHRYETALLRLQDLRQRFHQLRKRNGFKTEERLIEIQTIVFSLKKMQDGVESSLSSPNQHKVSVPRNNTQLADFVTQISAWREEIHYLDRSNRE